MILQSPSSSLTRHALNVNALADEIHRRNARWWRHPATGEPLQRNVGELLMLITSELAEALEGDRTGAMDKHLPERKSIEVELADALIRILDMAYGLGLDIGFAMAEKLEYNAVREDHAIEARLAKGGKRY